MDRHNSLETYVSLLVQLILDIADSYPSNGALLCISKLKHRVRAEGISFLTKTLPRYGKELDKLLAGPATSVLPSDGRKSKGGIPLFLGWILSEIVDAEGRVRRDANVQAIRHYRQIVYLVYKLKLPYAKTTEKSVVDAFIRTEGELRSLDLPKADIILEYAGRLVARCMSRVNVRDIIPKHGPGAVSTGEDVARKSRFSRIYERTEQLYPFTEYFMLGANHIVDQLDYIANLESSSTPTAKVVLVPKDSRGPRIISCEPLEIQWLQQGLRTEMYDVLERHPFTKGHINFRDQSVNRRLALSASRHRRLATLDMKDASDRVSLELVEKLFERVPHVLEALKATRSVRTRLPDGTEIELAKFAPMGSALCFPVEALCFFSLAAAVLHIHGKKSWRKAMASIYVYGDDIICDRHDVHLLLQYFPLYGLMFNESKCCVSGFFRESCGCDAYKGVDITPIRFRNTWCHRKPSASELPSWVSLSNSFWKGGYWRIADAIQSMVEAKYGPLPFVSESWTEPKWDSNPNTVQPAVIGWVRSHVSNVDATRARLKVRFNRALWRTEVYSYTVKAKHIRAMPDDWKECLRTLCGGKRSERGTYAVARRSCLTRKWVPLF